MRLLLSFFGLVALTIISPTVFAAENSLLFGQKQAYSVVVRADKKAVVYGKVIVNNPEEVAMKTTTFALPSGVNANDLAVLQIIPPQQCTEYDTADAKKCIKYESREYDFEQSYYGYYDYYPGNINQRAKYQQVEYKKSDSRYTLQLPSPIEGQKQGAYIVAYTTEDFTSGVMGFYSLNFKTLVVPEPVQQVTVSIDVDSDLYTKEKRSSVDYVDGKSDISALQEAKDQAAPSRNIDEIQGLIGSGGIITKTGKSLAPNETFVVKADFTDAEWKLNIGWIIGGIIGFIVSILLILLLMKKASKEDEKYYKNKKERKKWITVRDE